MVPYLQLNDIYHCLIISIFRSQQFHHYLQSEQSPLTLNHCSYKKRQGQITVEIQIWAWDINNLVTGLNRLIGS